MFGLGMVEIVIFALILLLFFGGKKLPELSRGISGMIREFKKAASSKEDEDGKTKNS